MNIRIRNLHITFAITIIFFISLTADVYSLNYEVGFRNNEDLIWKCNVCNINKMNDVFGENWSSSGLFKNLSQGKRMRWQINSVEENITSLLVNFNIWMWENEENWGIYDYSTEFSYLRNPSGYPSDYNLSNVIPFVPFWFPVPIGEYIGYLQLSRIYDIDNRVLPTLNVEINRGYLQSDYPSEKVLIIAIYNTDGILSSFKLYISGNVVVIDIEFESLPIYTLPVTLGLIGAFFIAIILYIKKQRNK